MVNIVNYSIKKSRSVIFLLAMILVYGSISYINIPKEDKPDVQIPIVIVSTSFRGISPEDSERLLTKPLENALKTIDNIKKLYSYSYSGGAEAIIEFSAGFDSKKALQDVRDKVNQTKSEFPAGTDEPYIGEVNLSKFPVLNISLFGNLPETKIIQIAKNLKDKITQVKNVLKVEIRGNREEAIELIINPVTLYNYGLDIQSIYSLIADNNKLIAAGSISNSHGSFSIKLPSTISDVTDILKMPVKSFEQKVVRVSDIVTVKQTFKDKTEIVRTNSIPSITLQVSKTTGSNIIDTIKNVRKVIDAEKEYLPANLNIVYGLDESEEIINNLSGLENNIVLAVILSLIPIILAIGIRSAILVAFSVPASFLIGVLFLSLMGHSLNIVVIFSLILSIGMLVDASIVVCEYADRKMLMGSPPKEAYIEATKRMWWPVFSATATTLVVFVPLFFWPGIIGQFMKYMPITIIATVGASLFVAYIFVPVLGTLIGQSTKLNEASAKSVMGSETASIENLTSYTKIYIKLLNKIILKPGRFVIYIIFSLVGVIFIYSKLGPGTEFFPKIEPKQAMIFVHARGNLSLDEKDKITSKLEKIINEYSSEIKIYNTKVIDLAREKQDVIAEITLEFYNWKYRRPVDQILEELRQKFTNLHGLKIDLVTKREGPGGNSPLQIEITSRDSFLLKDAGKKILEIVNNTKGVSDIGSNMDIPAIEWELIIDREKAAKYGANVNLIGNFVQMATNGLTITTYRPDYTDDEVDILVRFPSKYRNLNQLDNLFIHTASGKIPISNFVTKRPIHKTTSIKRTDGYKTINIDGNLKPDFLLDNVINEISQKITALNLDKAVSVNFIGEKEDQAETSSFLVNAFTLSLIAMFLMMLIQFNSFYQTTIIMSAVFLSTTGVLLGLLITNQPFGIVMCGIGIIALAGTVVNNNIIFIDTYNDLIKAGESVQNAIILTGSQRVRPIMLTAITSFLGLLPMVIGINIDFISREITFNAPSAQWWKQLSTTIAGGLVFATILTLFFTPCLLMIEAKLKELIINFFSKIILLPKKILTRLTA